MDIVFSREKGRIEERQGASHARSNIAVPEATRELKRRPGETPSSPPHATPLLHTLSSPTVSFGAVASACSSMYLRLCSGLSKPRCSNTCP